MALHNTLGKLGEILARAWLKNEGYEVLDYNWRYGRYEIDVVVLKKDVLHFVEVKTRYASPFGYPEDAVTRGKFRRLKIAAQAYLNFRPGFRWIQYDILAITFFYGAEPEYYFLEDVFI
ncbi:MAG: YraN family protein [Chitinophagaceae bacterium]